MEGVKKRVECGRARKREEVKVAPRSKSKIPISTSRVNLKSERGSFKSASVISTNKIHTAAKPKKLVNVPDKSSKLLMVDVPSDLAVSVPTDPDVAVTTDPNAAVTTDPAVNVPTTPAVTVPSNPAIVETNDPAVVVPSDPTETVSPDPAEAASSDLAVSMPTEFALNVPPGVPTDLGGNSPLTPRIRVKISNMASNLPPIFEQQDDCNNLSTKSESSLLPSHLSGFNKDEPTHEFPPSTIFYSSANTGIPLPPKSLRRLAAPHESTSKQAETELKHNPKYTEEKASSLKRTKSASDLNKESVVQVCRCPNPANSTVILYDDKTEVESEPGPKETDSRAAYPKDMMVLSVLGSMCGLLLISLFLYILFGPSLLNFLKPEEPGLIKNVIKYIGRYMDAVGTFMDAFTF